MQPLEKRIQKLEEELSYAFNDIKHLCMIIENLQKPEIHHHYYTMIHTTKQPNCEECNE